MLHHLIFFLLDANFWPIHCLITCSFYKPQLAKFQDDQRSMAIFSINCLYFKSLYIQNIRKKEFIDGIVNDIQLAGNWACVLRT